MGVANPFRKNNPSPKGRGRQASKSKYLSPEYGHDHFEREKAMEAEVYKQNYNKLKQKYMKETETSKNEMNKRMIL